MQSALMSPSLWVEEAWRRKCAHPSVAQMLSLLAEEWEHWCLKWETSAVVISCDNNPSVMAEKKEKGLHIPVICQSAILELGVLEV